MIRIAILGTRGIPAQYGGFETFVEQLAPRLAALGIDVTVFARSRSPRNDEFYCGARLRYVKYPSLGKYSEMIWDARCYYVARHSYDVVYMLGSVGAFAAWVPRLFGTKVWINTDGVEWKRTKFNWLQRYYLMLTEALSLLFANRIIADARAIEQHLRKRYFWPKQISVIAYGADIPVGHPELELIEEWGLEARTYYIVVCRMEPENHILEILEAFEQSHSSVPLVILGNVENPNAYVRKLLAKKSEKIRFVGTVFDKSKLSALRFYARAYIHGHSVGGTNPSLLEAMACSNLVVAHDNPFNREVLGEAGLYFANRQELSSIIDAIEDGREVFQNRRDAAKMTVKSHYHWDQIARAYFDLLHSR